MITIFDPSSFYFQAEIPEEDLSKISIGQTAKVILKAYPDQPLEGKVESIGFMAAKDNQFAITISISSALFLRLGLSGTATI